jgi:hypothetical protein
MHVGLLMVIVLGIGAVASPSLAWLRTGPPAHNNDVDELGRLSDLVLTVHHAVPEMEIDETGPTLRVTFINSRFSLLDQAEQKAKARQIARLILRSYTGERWFRIVVIHFAAGPFGTHGVASHAFLRSSLR